MEPTILFGSLIVGLVAGILRALLGYKKSGEDFEYQKFLTDVIFSVIIAPVLYLFVGITEMAHLFLFVFFGDVFIIELLKGIFKNIKE